MAKTILVLHISMLIEEGQSGGFSLEVSDDAMVLLRLTIYSV